MSNITHLYPESDINTDGWPADEFNSMTIINANIKLEQAEALLEMICRSEMAGRMVTVSLEAVRGLISDTRILIDELHR